MYLGRDIYQLVLQDAQAFVNDFDSATGNYPENDCKLLRFDLLHSLCMYAKDEIQGKYLTKNSKIYFNMQSEWENALPRIDHFSTDLDTRERKHRLF